MSRLLTATRFVRAVTAVWNAVTDVLLFHADAAVTLARVALAICSRQK